MISTVSDSVISRRKAAGDAKEIAAILAEENVELLPEEDKEKLQELDSLTGQPRATDILLYAIPVSPFQQLPDLSDLSGGWKCSVEAWELTLLLMRRDFRAV